MNWARATDGITHAAAKQKRTGNLPVLALERSWATSAAANQGRLLALRFALTLSINHVPGMMNSGVRKKPSRVFNQIRAM